MNRVIALLLAALLVGSISYFFVDNANQQAELRRREAVLQAEREAIKTVLVQDKAIYMETEKNLSFLDKYWNGADVCSKVSRSMDSQDLSNCPQDFQAAYKKHVSAWFELSRVHDSYGGLNGAVKGFFTAGFAVLTGNAELDAATKVVQATWSDVQQCAIAHGVAP